MNYYLLQPANLQQPPTSSGLDKVLDWGIFITLLLGLLLFVFRQNASNNQADQKVSEKLIENLLKTNADNTLRLNEIANAQTRQLSEEESVVFRLRSANESLHSIAEVQGKQQSELQNLERQISALHKRLDLSGTPSSHPYQQNSTQEPK